MTKNNDKTNPDTQKSDAEREYEKLVRQIMKDSKGIIDPHGREWEP